MAAKSSFLFGLVVTLICIHSAQTSKIHLEDQLASNATADRSERFLSLFTIVRFANSFCYGSNGYNGTCLTTAECALSGGTSSGSCAAGFGVCCTIFVSTSGSTITKNNTYWTNPGYSSSFTTSGQYSVYVKKIDSNICQLRLDFINFVIANPDQTAGTATQCLTDIFTVSGESNNVPGICGTNTNQHMYLDMTPSTNQFTLNMILSGTATSRTWNIRVAQIPCGTSYTAPDGCLQWYTSATGTISSFDYQFAATPVVQHIANQDYTICIRTNQGFCGICYQVCDVPAALTTPFLISVEAATTVIDTACLTDFIQIPCAVDQQSSTQILSTSGGTAATGGTPAASGVGCVSKICGGAFSAISGNAASAAVYSYRIPFEVRVYTDSYDAATTEGIGFCLKYQQQPCTSNNG